MNIEPTNRHYGSFSDGHAVVFQELGEDGNGLRVESGDLFGGASVEYRQDA